MLVGTKQFLESREYFKKHGVYTKALEGTHAYNEFWDEETKRCKEGYTIGDISITGNFYFYLNYNQIKMKDPITGRKTKDFPLFTDVDYEFFNHLKTCENLGKGLILVKPRRTGFSWKLSSIAAHEFNFYRDSYTVISAFEDKYSTNTFNMAKEHLNFLFNTPWYKPRSPDTNDYVLARHLKKVDGKEVWVGFNSGIKKLTFKDNPFASAGASASKFIFDEAGIFPNIKEAYNISEPTWKDGEDMIGTPIILGTGGDMGGGTHAFSEMYYNPEVYNLLAFDNIWEENSTKKCGWFIPAYRQRFGSFKDPETKKQTPLIDEEGNSNEELSKKAVLNERKFKEDDPIAFRDHTTQYPFTPADAFLVSTGNIFPTILLKDVKAKIESDPIRFLDANLTGFLEFNNGDLQFNYSDRVKPIRKYRIKREERFGCIEIFNSPERDADDQIFSQRYIGGIDPFDDDSAPTSVSLGSMFIFDRYTQRIVAEYTDRPEKASDFYENCRRLLLFYKAKALPENNKLGIVTYFEHCKSLHLLAETPVQLRNKTEWKPNLNTSYGYRTTKETNSLGNLLIVQWLKSQAPFAQNEGTLNIDQLYSLGLVDELIQYNPDPKYNYDRISALRACLIYDDTLFRGNTRTITEDDNNIHDLNWSMYWNKAFGKPNYQNADTPKENDHTNSYIGLFKN